MPGSICITTKALDPLFRDYIEIPICGKLIKRPCVIDQKTAAKLIKAAEKFSFGRYDIRSGATVSTNDFYEEQGRTNGAICDHTEEDKMEFLYTAAEKSVINFEMEANYLSAMCTKLKVKHGTVCVSLLDRMLDDKIPITPEEVKSFEHRLFCVNSIFLRDMIGELPPKYDEE